jgi:hypothetical protein
MNMIENELFQVIVLSNQDRIAELEASEWARLDPVE